MQPQIVGVAELTEVSGEERVGIVRDDDRRSRLLSAEQRLQQLVGQTRSPASSKGRSSKVQWP